MMPSKVTMTPRQETATTAVIDIEGEVSSAAEDELMAAYAEAIAQGAENFVLNFAHTDYINSSGIGLLVTLLIRANRQGHTLLACGLTEHYRRIFELTRLNEAIRVFDTEFAALTAAAEADTSV
jgi:anti-sigma B factor antagonist